MLLGKWKLNKKTWRAIFLITAQQLNKKNDCRRATNFLEWRLEYFMLPLVSTLILGLFKLGGYLLVLGTYLNFVKDVRISLISKGCLLFFCQVYATTYHSLYHLLKIQNLFFFQTSWFCPAISTPNDWENAFSKRM